MLVYQLWLIGPAGEETLRGTFASRKQAEAEVYSQEPWAKFEVREVEDMSSTTDWTLSKRGNWYRVYRGLTMTIYRQGNEVCLYVVGAGQRTHFTMGTLKQAQHTGILKGGFAHAMKLVNQHISDNPHLDLPRLVQATITW